MKTEYDILCGGIKAGQSPEDFLKKVKQQLECGKLTKEEAVVLLRQYMDSLDYSKLQMVTDCGGIQPEVIECTEQF